MSADAYDDHERRLERHNEVVRSAAGPTILQLMDQALVEAWRKYDEYKRDGDDMAGGWGNLPVGVHRKLATMRGRVRGLAQAIAIVKSPYSYMDGGAAIGRYIKGIEDEAHAKARRA